MPIWSCLPFPPDGCFQKLHFRNLREKLEGNSYFLTYSLTLYLKVCSGHLWQIARLNEFVVQPGTNKQTNKHVYIHSVCTVYLGSLDNSYSVLGIRVYRLT